MKILKKLANICLIIFFALPFCMVYADGGDMLHIAAPDIRSKCRYYIAQPRGWDKFYVEERQENTCRKTHGAFVERVRFGEYIVYDDTSFPEEFTHVIKTINSDNYIVGVHYSSDQIIPILRITRESAGSPWHIKSCHIIGRVCLPSTEVYIEEISGGLGRVVRSAVSSPDIAKGEVYNLVTPLGSLDEFTDIISFCSAFLFK